MTDTTEPHHFAGKVVIGVDGSERSHDAVRWGGAWAAALGTDVTVLHAWEMPVGSVRGMGYDVGVVEQARESGHEILDAAAAVLTQAHPSVTGQTALVPGGPVQALLGASADARALVIGTRGRGALASLILGSTSDAVAARADCPVILVPEGAGWVEQGRVLLTSDGSEDAAAATAYAFALAAHRRVRLEVLVSVEQPTHLGTDALYLPPDMPEMLEAAREAVDRSLQGCRDGHPDVPVEVTALAGPLDDAVAERSGTACLVVTGSRGHGAALGLLTRSASRQAISAAACPVAVVKG